MDWLLPAISIFLVLSGTALASYITYKFRNQSNSNQTQIININDEINTSIEKVKDLNSKILKLNNELNTINTDIQTITQQTHILSKENKDLINSTMSISKSINSYISSENSFCYILGSLHPLQNSHSTFLTHKGKYPLRNIKIEIINQTALHNIKELRQPNDLNAKERIEIYSRTLENNTFIYSFDSMTPGSSITLNNIPILDQQKELYLEIKIQTENKFLFQKLKYINTSGSFKYATEITDINADIIYQDIHKDFQKNNKGKIDWD